MLLKNIEVPDIGDIQEATVIEILVKVGDLVKAEQSLITLESDKASMEVPSPLCGKVEAVLVKLGDRVGQGSLILRLSEEGQAQPTSPPQSTTASVGSETLNSTSSGQIPERHDCDVLVLGGGPGGYSAAFRAADLGLKVILVERYATLGGVCLNVGCIPSKALLHVANLLDEVTHLHGAGVSIGKPTVDLAQLRRHKAGITSKLTAGLTSMAKGRGVRVVRGYGTFIDPHHVLVKLTGGEGQDQTGETTTLSFRRCVVAAGSQPVRLAGWPQDPRVVDSTGALALPAIPKTMLIVGGGIIGLEMATVYSSLGAQVDVVEWADGLMPGADRDLVAVWQRINARRFGRVMLNTKTASVNAKPEGIEVCFESILPSGPAPESQTYDLVLQAAGRSPNGHRIGAKEAGVLVDERGFISVDQQMRTKVDHIFSIGDIVGQPMLAHKAVHEGHVAAEVIAGELLNVTELMRARFDARVIPSVAYTNPELAWVGITEQQAKQTGLLIRKGVFPWAASGRALANGRAEGFTKLIFDEASGRIVGGGIVGDHAGDLISEIALAIEMGADAIDIGKTIHPHPTLGETVGLAAEVAKGTCTDLPRQPNRS